MKRSNPFESLETRDSINNTQNIKNNINNNTQPDNQLNSKDNINNLFNKTEKEKKVIKTIYISEKLSQKLENISKEYNISVNEVITTILEKTLVN